MANYTVPSRHGGQISLQTQDRDHLPALDVVWSNKYEGEVINPTNARKMELEFYKGAPPQWLNFYWAEQQKSPFVKRDMYKSLEKEIDKLKTTKRSIAHINLFHEPGSGGSTLAMQLLWARRNKLRCAKLLDSATDKKAIAQQVLRLFRAGGLEQQNTVLLLLDNKYTSDDASFKEELEENLCTEITVNNITATIPVVIILNCLRQTDLAGKTKESETKQNWNLYLSLSPEEQDSFKRKESELIQIHGNTCLKQLHAFNIMLSNNDPRYVREVCSVLQSLKKTRRPRKQQLLAILALINSYVPSSDLPLDLCQTFLKGKSNNRDNFSLEEHMKPFTEFLVIFSKREEEASSEDAHVRLVHRKIAQECLRLLTEVRVNRSDTTLLLLRELCRDDMPQSLVKTVKTLLTKREQDQSSQLTTDKFSKLILDIKTEEKKSMCVAVLKMAVRKFDTVAHYPQTLARFYYIEMEDYVRAEHWAKYAITKDERNSFIRDTLGQVRKNWLKNGEYANATEVLQHGKKAVEAFKAEEEVSRQEEAPDMMEHGMTSISTIFNNRGIFGYMQVAKIIFDCLTKLQEEWSKVLTKEMTLGRFLQSYESRKCEKYKSLITSLREDVKDKFEFFEWYLLYSKPSVYKNEPSYFQPEVSECYIKFVTGQQQNKSALQILMERKASTFAGLLCKSKDPILELITEQWKEIYLQSKNDVQVIQNFIAANVMLSQWNDRSTALTPLGELQAVLHNLWIEQKHNRSPEFYLLVLLLFWLDEQQDRHNGLDLGECIRYMHQSFDKEYKTFLRRRYLVPLFFLTARCGLQRFIHKSCLNENLLHSFLTEGTEISELRRVRGEVRNYKVFAIEGSEKIEVSPDHPASVHGQGKVSFCLGINIKGPMAYNIKYEQ